MRGGGGGSFSDMRGGRGGGGCAHVGLVRVGEVCSGTVVGCGVVLVCGMQLVLCMWEVGRECGDTVVGDGVVCRGECDDTVVRDSVVLPMRLVCVGKPACSHVCRLSVVGIGVSLFGPALSGFLVSFLL